MELQELLALVAAIEMKDVEVGHVLRALVNYLMQQEAQKTQPLKGGKNNAN